MQAQRRRQTSSGVEGLLGAWSSGIEGLLGEASSEAVLSARGRLGRQEARPEAVLRARRPKTSVLAKVRAKTLVLRRRQQVGTSAGGLRTPKFPRRQAAIAEFLYR